MIPGRESVLAHLSRRFVSADGALVDTLATRVSRGQMTLESAEQSLRDMGFPETHTAAPVQLEPAARPKLPTTRPAPAGGEARNPSRQLSGLPQSHVRAWTDDTIRSTRGSFDVSAWQRDTVLPESSGQQHSPPRPQRNILSPAVSAVPNDQRGRSREVQSPDVVATDDVAASPSPKRDAAARPQRSRTAGPGKTRATSDDPVSANEVVLYTTSITTERQVRDHVRGMERMLFLHRVPYHPFDVAENRFMRRQLVDMVGGEDKGLPLLFVGDTFIGTFPEVEDLVDEERFIDVLEAAGYRHAGTKAPLAKASTGSCESATTAASSPKAMSPLIRNAAPSSVARIPSRDGDVASTTVDDREERLRRWRETL